MELAQLSDTGELVELTVKPNFRELGRRFGKRTQAVASAIQRGRPGSVRRGRYRAGHAQRRASTARRYPIGGDEVIIAETPRSGWAVASAGSDTVALDLELTHELRLAGLVREVVRIVQDARKNAGLEVTDRIELWWRVGGSPEPAEAIRAHADAARSRGAGHLARRGRARASGRCLSAIDEELGLHVWLRRA